MDPTTYNCWWQLHLRVAKGETLSPTERAEYQAETAKFDEMEQGQLRKSNLIALRALRAQIDELRNVHAEIAAKSTKLDAQIVVLEDAVMG